MARYRYKYSSVAEIEEGMLNQLQEILNNSGIGGSLANAVMQTTSEMFTNALVHGNHLDPNKMITVEIEVDTIHIKINVIDQGEGGAGFSRNRLVVDPMAESGRGISLMKHFAASIKFHSTSAGGLKVSATFNRKENYKTSLHN